jgi:hypothetical protein
MRFIAGASLAASFDRYPSADLATVNSAHALRQETLTCLGSSDQ